MSIATFKDLCIDAVDPVALGDFWAATLGLGLTRLDDGDVRLDGPTPQHAVWVNKVPEPVTVKQRVHLDVHAASVDEVLARGATPEDLESFRWDVLRDPEGGELCVFTRDEVPPYKLYEIVVDSARPGRDRGWWAEVLGATVQHDADDGSSWFEDAPRHAVRRFVFGRCPNPRRSRTASTGTSMSTTCNGCSTTARPSLREADDVVSWHVLADPEGNEFCAFVRKDG